MDVIIFNNALYDLIIKDKPLRYFKNILCMKYTMVHLYRNTHLFAYVNLLCCNKSMYVLYSVQLYQGSSTMLLTLNPLHCGF